MQTLKLLWLLAAAEALSDDDTVMMTIMIIRMTMMMTMMIIRMTMMIIRIVLFLSETKVASAYGRSRGLLCRVEEGGGEEEKARGEFKE